ncbi:MAG: hypothetical protein ACE5KJ_07920, partial [Candidatus Zixiibacteriota bacterium]
RYLLKKAKRSTPDTKARLLCLEIGHYGTSRVRRFCRTFKDFGKATLLRQINKSHGHHRDLGQHLKIIAHCSDMQQ